MLLAIGGRRLLRSENEKWAFTEELEERPGLIVA
jgi:hypothetical protein